MAALAGFASSRLIGWLVGLTVGNGNGQEAMSGAEIVVAVAVGLVAAAAGGALCGKIDPTPRATRILVGILLVAGMVAALAVSSGSEALVEAIETAGDTADARMLEQTMEYAGPNWLLWTLPAISAIGAVLGSRFARRST